VAGQVSSSSSSQGEEGSAPVQQEDIIIMGERDHGRKRFAQQSNAMLGTSTTLMYYGLLSL